MSITSAALVSTHAVSPAFTTFPSCGSSRPEEIVGVACFQDTRRVFPAGERTTGRRYVRVTRVGGSMHGHDAVAVRARMVSVGSRTVRPAARVGRSVEQRVDEG